VQNVTL
jgi:hypothetical protein